MVLIGVAAIVAGFIGATGGLRAAREHREALRAIPHVPGSGRDETPGAAGVPVPGSIAAPEGVMPLAPATLDAFQESTSDAEQRLLAMRPELSPPVRASLAFRNSVIAQGFDPDRTLLYWLSPQFKEDVAKADPSVAVMHARTVENLVAVALGDGLGTEEFRQLLTFYSADVRAAAEERRTAK